MNTTSMQEAATAVRPRAIPALTGLRAVAATLVVLFHLQRFAGPYLDELPLLRPVIAAGWTGVELFFVLSGFVLTWNHVDRFTRPGARAIGSFLLHRFARVWPAWAAVTVLMGGALAGMQAIGWDTGMVTPHPDLSVTSWASQLGMVQMWGGAHIVGASFVLPGWSISAEWFAYLLFPVLLLLIRPLRRLPAWVLLSLAVATMAPLSAVAYLFGPLDVAVPWQLRIAAGFTAGVLTALAVRRVQPGDRVASAALTMVWTAVFLIATIATWASWRRGTDFSHDYAGVIVLLFPLLVAGLALTDRGPSSWLASGPLTYGGRLSYCLYLVHFVVIDVTVTAAWQDPARRGLLGPALGLAVPLIIVASFLLSAALHHGVEEPCRRLVLRAARVRPDAERSAVPTVLLPVSVAPNVAAMGWGEPEGSRQPAPQLPAVPRPRLVAALERSLARPPVVRAEWRTEERAGGAARRTVSPVS